MFGSVFSSQVSGNSKYRVQPKYSKYLKLPDIPERKEGTWRYSMKYFNTSTRPEPARYLTFSSIPDPDIDKTLPLGPFCGDICLCCSCGMNT